MITLVILKAGNLLQSQGQRKYGAKLDGRFSFLRQPILNAYPSYSTYFELINLIGWSFLHQPINLFRVRL